MKIVAGGGQNFGWSGGGLSGEGLSGGGLSAEDCPVEGCPVEGGSPQGGSSGRVHRQWFMFLGTKTGTEQNKMKSEMNKNFRADAPLAPGFHISASESKTITQSSRPIDTVVSGMGRLNSFLHNRDRCAGC